MRKEEATQGRSSSGRGKGADEQHWGWSTAHWIQHLKDQAHKHPTYDDIAQGIASLLEGLGQSGEKGAKKGAKGHQKGG